MFEYLMPLLVMRSWPMTLLDQTYDSVVRRQIQYGRERGCPGASPSRHSTPRMPISPTSTRRSAFPVSD